MRESEEYKKKLKEIESYKSAKKLESSLSNGRKIFRLLLFLNEMNELYDLMRYGNRSSKMLVLKIISTCCSFVYYLADNIVFFAKLEFLPGTIPNTDIKWKRIKNMFSLTKTVLEIIIAFYQIHLKTSECKQILNDLKRENTELVEWKTKGNFLIR